MLDALWYDYCIGHLNVMAQKYLVKKDVLKEFDLTELKLTAAIQREEYIVSRKFFFCRVQVSTYKVFRTAVFNRINWHCLRQCFKTH